MEYECCIRMSSKFNSNLLLLTEILHKISGDNMLHINSELYFNGYRCFKVEDWKW